MSENTTRKQGGRPFQPGQSGNPSGKPKGARHKVTLAVEALLDGEAEALTRRAIDKALEGDTTALRLCLERLAPAPKERPVAIELPAITAAADAPTAIAAIIASASTGEIAPAEAASLVSLVERWRAAFEMSEIERRLTALEGRR